jgi:succinate dehydrogenase/fumarate reductase flavoprotein subunit
MEIYSKALRPRWKTDVLVIGSGSAGATGALAAANEEASVALMERYGFMGGISTQIDIRESRRIFGEYRLTREDVLAARKFDDAIARCGAPIEEHHAGDDTRWEYLHEGETHQMPYRCLVPRSVEGLLAAGRCLPADHHAHASVRSRGQCMAMGQAAGVAAAFAARQSFAPRDVAVPELQDRLRAIGAEV